MSGNFKEFYSKWNIRLSPSTPRYPQGNGQAESYNKLIIDGIKKRLDLMKDIGPTNSTESCGVTARHQEV